MRPSGFVFAVFIALLSIAPGSAAQSFAPVASGSGYYCGTLPDGSRKLFTLGASGYAVADSSSARGALNGEISYLKKRIARLVDLRSDLKDDDIRIGAALVKFSKLVGDINRVGIDYVDEAAKSKREQIQDINQLIALIRFRIQNRKKEIAGIRDCDDGKAPPAPSSFNGSVVVIRDGTEVSIAYLVKTSAKQGRKSFSYRWFCISLPGSTGFSPRLFGVNPCVNEGLSVANCSSFVGRGEIGYLDRVTTFGFEPDQDDIDRKVNEAQERLNRGPILGRVRGKTGTPGTAETNRDTCN